MASDLKLYRVFIASPGGLTAERTAFREAIAEYNESDAIHRKVYFSPVGWEVTLPGMGRPQAIINRDIEDSDYLVLVLWDRWGTPPADSGNQYTSGTHEEYSLACQCHARADRPMREISVFFKSVDPSKLSDPGDQLKAVLHFRHQLEEEHRLLFQQFDEPNAFKQMLKCLLAKWLREYELPSDSMIAPPELSATDFESRQVLADSDGSSIESISSSKASSAEEQKMASEMAKGSEASALRYAMILRDSNRLRQAEDVVLKLLEPLPSATDEARIRALAVLANIKTDQLSFSAAQKYLRQAQRIAKRIGSDSQVLRGLYLQAGQIELIEGHQGEAVSNFLRATKEVDPNNDISLAFIQSHVGAGYALAHEWTKALTPFQEALFLREQNSTQPRYLVDRVRMINAITLIALGEFEQSKILLEKVEAGDKGLMPIERNPLWYRTRAWTAWSEKDKENAEGNFRAALSFAEQHSDVFNVISYLEDLGMFLSLCGKYREAEYLGLRAFDIVRDTMGKRHPLADLQLLQLGLLYVSQGGFEQAEGMAVRGLKALSSLNMDTKPRAATFHYLLSLTRWGGGDNDLALASLAEASHALSPLSMSTVPLSKQIVRLRKILLAGKTFAATYGRFSRWDIIPMGPITFRHPWNP